VLSDLSISIGLFIVKECSLVTKLSKALTQVHEGAKMTSKSNLTSNLDSNTGQQRPSTCTIQLQTYRCRTSRPSRKPDIAKDITLSRYMWLEVSSGLVVDEFNCLLCIVVSSSSSNKSFWLMQIAAIHKSRALSCLLRLFTACARFILTVND
jgi:hypothetical protein